MTRGPEFAAEVGASAQRALERVFEACSNHTACRGAFPTALDDFYATYDELTRTPIEVPVPLDSPTDTIHLDGTKLIDIVRSGMLNRPGRLRALPLLLHELRRGDRARAARTLASFASLGPATSQQVLVQLVHCYETYSPEWQRLHDATNRRVRPPFRNDDDKNCPLWQVRSADSSARARIRSDIPTLILTAEFDDRTPTEHARLIAAGLTRAYVHELPGLGHGGPPRGPAGCHLSLITQFLADPLREPDSSCVGQMPRIAFVTNWSELGGV